MWMILNGVKNRNTLVLRNQNAIKFMTILKNTYKV